MDQDKYNIDRKFYILKLLLLGIVAIAFAALFCTILESARLGDKYVGVSPWVAGILLLFFIFFYRLAKRGYYRWPALFMFLVFSCFSIFSMYKSGMDNQFALLMAAFTINIAAILIELRFVLYFYIVIFVGVGLIGWLQVEKIIYPDIGWRQLDLGYSYVIAYLSFLLVIVVVSWLYNREISRSLQKAWEAEEELKKERDLLEVRVEERTKELKEAQVRQIFQLSRFAEYGKSMSGLLHDLINPVTAISLNLNHLKTGSGEKKVKDVEEFTGRALVAAKKMQEFIEENKNRMKDDSLAVEFLVKKEFDDILQFFIYKSKKKAISINTEINEEVIMYGNKFRFDQILSNLISNAMDAYENLGDDTRNKKILIKVNRFGDGLQIVVRDWARGIDKKNIGKIFEPFFTTKKDINGMGIGLFIVKNNIEEYFGGKISVESKLGKGTTFYVSLPINNKKDHEEQIETSSLEKRN